VTLSLASARSIKFEEGNAIQFVLKLGSTILPKNGIFDLRNLEMTGHRTCVIQIYIQEHFIDQNVKLKGIYNFSFKQFVSQI